MSSHSSHRSLEVLLAPFSLHVRKCGLKTQFISFHLSVSDVVTRSSIIDVVNSPSVCYIVTCSVHLLLNLSPAHLLVLLSVHLVSVEMKLCIYHFRNWYIHSSTKIIFIYFACSSSKFGTLQICLNGKKSSNTSRESHLGNIIRSNIMYYRIKLSIDDLYMRTYQLLWSFGFIIGNVKRKVFNSFCMAVYGSQLWDYSTNAPKSFIPPGGNVSGDYLIKLIQLYYLYCGMLNPYMFNFINVL